MKYNLVYKQLINLWNKIGLQTAHKFMKYNLVYKQLINLWNSTWFTNSS